MNTCVGESRTNPIVQLPAGVEMNIPGWSGVAAGADGDGANAPTATVAAATTDVNRRTVLPLTPG
jgi:hypothetical protein